MAIITKDLGKVTPDIDTTLTQSGQAADAKATGDEIDDLKEDLSQKAPVIVNASDEAEVVTFSDGADDMPMKSLVLKLVPHQEGTRDPSPENVRPISGYTAVNVARTGKNLFDSDGIFLSVSEWKYENGYYYGNPKALHLAYWDGIDLLPHDTSEVYTVSFDAYSSINQRSLYVYVVYTDDTYFRVAVEATDWTHYTFTTTNGKTIKYFKLSYSNQVVTYIRNFQIEVGSAETTYEPYHGETYPITLPQTVYGGELDVVNGKLRVTHGYIASYGGQSINTPWLSSMDVYASGRTPTTGAQVVYPLATPIEITIDPVTIKTLLGSNTIWMDADGTIQCEYPADTKLYIDALTVPDDDMIADSNIASGKYFTVNNRLYISTSAIAQGEAIVVGTNCTQTDLATALNALNA